MKRRRVRIIWTYTTDQRDFTHGSYVDNEVNRQHANNEVDRLVAIGYRDAQYRIETYNPNNLTEQPTILRTA